jgi:hypothetical protein
MFQPLVMSCPRDLGLLLCLLSSLAKVADPRLLPPVVTFEREEWPSEKTAAHLGRRGAVLLERGTGYGQWCWASSVIKLKSVGEVARMPFLTDDDYLWCVDSDVVLVSGRVFDLVHGADLFGSPHSVLTPTPRFGLWGHLSGATIFLRVKAAREIAKFTREDLATIEREMRADGLCVNEDVVLTYAAQYAGATRIDLTGPEIACSDPVGCLMRGEVGDFSVVHYAGDYQDFGGAPVKGKWDIPGVIPKLGEWSL